MRLKFQKEAYTRYAMQVTISVSGGKKPTKQVSPRKHISCKNPETPFANKADVKDEWVWDVCEIMRPWIPDKILGWLVESVRHTHTPVHDKVDSWSMNSS